MIRRLIPFIQFKTVNDKNLILSLKNITGYKPVNINLYKQAFIHSSKTVKNDSVKYNNERLEFLGDAILGAIIGEYLFKKYPNKLELLAINKNAYLINK